METYSLTPEQIQIVDAIQAGNNSVVIASPGSGKTSTLAHVIRQILPGLPEYQGVIAISFTNKASDELEHRCLLSGLPSKNSYFGTIDKFFLNEIIIPFGKHLFGNPGKEMEIVQFDGFEDSRKDYLGGLLEKAGDDIDQSDLVDELSRLFQIGFVLLDTVGFLGLTILEASISGKRYLKSRYSHVFIDEYQDCDDWQHRLFTRLVDLGLVGVAVGDTNQSIFEFAKKDSRFLIELSHDVDRFKTFPLTANHRSHPSITNYASRVISSSFQPLDNDQINVFHKKVDGSEIEIAHWLNDSIPFFQELYKLKPNEVAVLVKNRRSGNLIHQNISIPHKPIATTPLDDDSSYWGNTFRRILTWAFSEDETKYELIEKNLSIGNEIGKATEVMKMLIEIEAAASVSVENLQKEIGLFVDIARIFFPTRPSEIAVEKLSRVLADPVMIRAFTPPHENEVQLLTLHKSKGLEFGGIFHLDLYRWIHPIYHGDKLQELNLHYVGITRAKKCCILCTSTYRHKGDASVVEADPSEYLTMNELPALRLASPI